MKFLQKWGGGIKPQFDYNVVYLNTEEGKVSVDKAPSIILTYLEEDGSTRDVKFFNETALTYKLIEGRNNEWSNCPDNLVGVKLNEGVKEIGYCGLFGAKNVKEIIIPESVEYFRYCAFAGSGIEKFTYPTDHDIFVDGYCFSGCTALTTVNSDVEGQANLYSNLKNGTNSPLHRFDQCTAFINVFCDMEELGDFEFWGADSEDNMQTLVIGDHVKSVKEGAFYLKNENKNIEVFDTNKIEGFDKNQWGNYITPLYSCMFDTLILNKPLKDFGYIASSSEFGTLIVKSPWVLNTKSFTSSYDYSVSPNAQRSNLYDKIKKNIIIDCDETTTIAERCFYNTYNATSITICDNIEIIGDSAFNYCYSVSNIKLPLNLKRIGNKAFYDLHELPLIILPNNIEQIDDEAFNYCSSLSSVMYNDVEYTSKSALQTALTNNGVILGNNVFNATALTA